MDANAGGRLERQARLVAALVQELAKHTPATHLRLLETHISYVLLTGQYAYKIKKAIDLGFLDFTSLSARQFYCDEELRLNRRLAPDLYLDVTTIGGPLEQPTLPAIGPALEYAVKMREFSQEELADQLLASGKLSVEDVDDLARRIAEFHSQVAVADGDMHFGEPKRVIAPILQNFKQIKALSMRREQVDVLEVIRAWTLRRYAALEPLLLERKAQGFVRECHGDLHFGNIARIDGAMTIFDCIEFNQDLRWIDVIDEIAFIMMDLEYRGRVDYSWRLLNRYLELTGDYNGVRLLDFYQVYRALVRAKVALLRSAQKNSTDQQVAATTDFAAHLRLATAYTRPRGAALVITHGLPGSGKTTATQGLLEKMGAIRIRSDVERKRLFGLAPMSRTDSSLGRGIYSMQAGEQTYTRLAQLSAMLLEAGCRVIVDATFLSREERERFRVIAQDKDCGFIILNVQAPVDTLRGRVAARERTPGDASEAGPAVLEHQLARYEPLAGDEPQLVIDASCEPSTIWQGSTWQALNEGLGDL